MTQDHLMNGSLKFGLWKHHAVPANVDNGANMLALVYTFHAGPICFTHSQGLGQALA